MDYGPANRTNIKHVERKELYTNLCKRIEYLHAFVDFTSDDIEILKAGSRILKAAVPQLAHRMYEKLLQFDITARALKTRTTYTEDDVDDLFTIDSPHVQRRKIFWKWYLTRLTSADPSQMEFWEYLAKLGQIHTGSVLIHPLRIEYIHMNAALGYLQDLFFETISTHPLMSPQFRMALMRALSKMFCVQNDLIARCYVRDGAEFAPLSDDDLDSLADEEAASIAPSVHSENGTINSDTASTPEKPPVSQFAGVCPFSGKGSIPAPPPHPVNGRLNHYASDRSLSGSSGRSVDRDTTSTGTTATTATATTIPSFPSAPSIPTTPSNLSMPTPSSRSGLRGRHAMRVPQPIATSVSSVSAPAPSPTTLPMREKKVSPGPPAAYVTPFDGAVPPPFQTKIWSPSISTSRERRSRRV